MTPDFDYSEVPFGFNYCLNKSCKQASTCLRYRSHSHPYLPDHKNNQPRCATIDNACPFFHARQESAVCLRHHPLAGSWRPTVTQSAGILSSSFLGDDIAYTVPPRWRLEMDRLCRSRQSWRHAGADDSPMAVLPQDENALYGRIGHDCRSNSYLRLLHPPCQSDEF